MLLLTLSTYMTLSPGVFFAFVIINGLAQASAGSYMQTAVVAIASLFGPTAMQAVMSGQAAVGVVVSGVQVISAWASIHAAGGAGLLQADEVEAETQAAFIFFSLSTVFLIVTILSHAWLVQLPVYKNVVAPFERAKARHSREISTTSSIASIVEDKERVWRLIKTNAIYEFAVAYVFVVTLVSKTSHSLRECGRFEFICVYRPSSRQ